MKAERKGGKTSIGRYKDLKRLCNEVNKHQEQTEPQTK